MTKVLALTMVLSASAQAVEFHVSPDGRDSNEGTRKQPFRTLAKARNELRNARADSSVAATVVLESGTYHLSQTFELDERDSNTIYQAANGHEVRISGGIEVSIKDLKPVSDKHVLDLLPEKVGPKVVVLELPDSDPGGSAKWPERFRGYAGWPEVYAGERPFQLARWPNTGYATISEVLDRGSQPRTGDKPDRGGQFVFSEENPGNWSDDQPVYLGGYWCVKWYDEFIRVESIDSEKKQIKMAAPHHYGLGGPSQGLYFAINLLEELDLPGEYVYDTSRNILYMLPPADAGNVLNVSILRKPLVSLKNARNLSFIGITFENGRDTGVEISDCESVLLSKCIIRQISGTGVDVAGGKECGLDQSELKTIGKTAVKLNGGDRTALTESQHFVTNCRISRFARLEKTYCPAVSLRGVGQKVSNNHLYDAPHCAILFEGNNHRISFNHIERVCLDTSDAGAIYCGRDWTLGGNRIHGNFIHSLGNASHHQNWAIYLDDMASGIEVSKNIVIDTDAGFLIGGGRSNVIKNNLISNCPKVSIYFDARATGWAGDHVAKPDGTLWTRLNQTPFNSGIWKERFPYLEKIEGDAHEEPRRNRITGNLLFGTPALQLDPRVTTYGTVEGNLRSEIPPTIQLKDGKISVSNDDLKQYRDMAIGPLR